MQSAPSLHELQSWLRWVLTDPRGVSPALNEPKPKGKIPLERYTQPGESLLPFVFSDHLTATQRLDVYAEGYFSRILEVMNSNFPRTAELLGEDLFTIVTADYLKIHFSKTRYIDEIGKNLPQFLSQYGDNELPLNAAEIAQYEWNLVLSFYAAEPEIDEKWTQELAQTSAVALRVHPSVFLQKSWLNSDQYKLIFRFRDQISEENIPLYQYQILSALREGKTLDQALEFASAVEQSEVAQFFSHLVSKQILCGILKEEKNV